MDSQRYLTQVFDALTAATTCDACVRIAAQAAKALADADGLCILSPDGDRCLVARADGNQVSLCDLRNSTLHRAAALPQARIHTAGSKTLWGKEDVISLPTGEGLSIGVALIVPVRAEGSVAVGFFWYPGRTTDPHRARQLELLAKALGLASRTWRRDEEHAARLRDEQRISADVQHPLRNNLALLRSILRRSHETAESAEYFAMHLEARIGALTRIQAALGVAAAAGVDLEELVRTELIASAAAEQRCVVQGPAVRLHGRCAELLALTVHELATNSLKFGALAAVSGRLLVRWSVTEGPARLQLGWSERGVTIASAAPRRRGFGQELIEHSLPYELGARTGLRFTPGGVSCDIEIPLQAGAWTMGPAAQVVLHGAGSW
jgi:two-component sensor histidine kinase